ncbi:Uncharacterized protein TCM_027709 [Theobroma cacao]|uniref:Uncharacterized protein n=1 Tax=Theobroma cacao TaxID=3641 RepID=A0A061G9K7_THECC|nr:Uncharacterized protein TCM_027709 [Theobroma cacao]
MCHSMLCYLASSFFFLGLEDSEPVKHIDRIYTYVMGKKIVVTQHTLDFVLDFDIHQGNLGYVKGILPNEVLSTMYTYSPTSEKNITSVKQLSFYHRILHHVMSHTLCPHGINYSTIKSEDFWFLYCIKSNHHVNLAKFILDDMLKIINKSDKTFLYGMAINAIIDSKGINTRDEGNDDTFAEPSATFSASSSVHRSVDLSFLPMSIAFNKKIRSYFTTNSCLRSNFELTFHHPFKLLTWDITYSKLLLYSLD